MNEQENKLVDRVFDAIKNSLKSLGGLLNPWLWVALLLIIFVGQTLAVQIFIWIALGISAYFSWIHGENSLFRRAVRAANNAGTNHDSSRD